MFRGHTIREEEREKESIQKNFKISKILIKSIYHISPIAYGLRYTIEHTYNVYNTVALSLEDSTLYNMLFLFKK